jgi:hypothetical protein
LGWKFVLKPPASIETEPTTPDASGEGAGELT